MPPLERLRGYFRLSARPLGRVRTAQPRLDRVLKGLGEAKRSPYLQTGRALRRMVAGACHAKSLRIVRPCNSVFPAWCILAAAPEAHDRKDEIQWQRSEQQEMQVAQSLAFQRLCGFGLRSRGGTAESLKSETLRCSDGCVVRLAFPFSARAGSGGPPEEPLSNPTGAVTCHVLADARRLEGAPGQPCPW